MKKYLILLSLSIASCSTINIKEQIVKDFIKEKILKNNQNITNSFLIEETGSNNKILDFYKMAYYDRALPIHERRFAFSPQNFTNWPMDSTEVNTLVDSVKKDSLPHYWNRKKFKSFDLPIIKKDSLLLKVKNDVLPISATGYIISEPILNLNKKYALIKYSSVLYVGGISDQIYLLKKENNKWTVILQLYDPNVFY